MSIKQNAICFAVVAVFLWISFFVGQFMLFGDELITGFDEFSKKWIQECFEDVVFGTAVIFLCWLATTIGIVNSLGDGNQYKESDQ